MKPTTKLHFEVLALNEKLKDIPNRTKDWAYKKAFKHYAWKTQHKAACFECGSEWKYESTPANKLFGIKCPACGKELEVKEKRNHHYVDEDFFMILETVKNFQVVRIFQIRQILSKGYESSYSCGEIIRHYVRSDGKQTVLARDVATVFWNTRFSWFGPFEIRGVKDKYFINGCHLYPKKKILPEIKRNGYTGRLFGYNIAYFFYILLSFPMLETLVKSGQSDLIKEFNLIHPRIDKFWSQIKICIRHNYIITDSRMWFDHLGLLEHFGKDLHNPKFICPENLKAEHQALVDLRQKEIDKENLKSLLDKINVADPVYRKDKEKYFNLKFSNGVIDIIVLKSVKEFFLEGSQLHHCVFNSKYYEKPDSLILSARKGTERIETLEVNLRDFKIMQSHGVSHTVSKYRKQILELVNGNMDVIKKVKRSRKKTAA